MNKRIISALALTGAVALASCNKAEQPTTTPTAGALVTVTFDYRLSGGTPFLTKTAEGDFLFSLTPTSPLALTLTDAKGKTYSATTGQSITLPQGVYAVTYEDKKPDIAQTFCSTAFLSKVPLVKIEQEVTISATTTTIPLTARYMSSAILFDTAEVQNIQMQSITGNTNDVSYETSGGLGAFFFTGTLEGKCGSISFIAKDGYKSAGITISTDGYNGSHILEAGKYYFMRLSTPNTTASFSFSVMDWTEGGDLN